MSPFVSPEPFWPSTCSISLPLSLSCSFLSFFLLVFLFLLSFGSFFFSLSFFFCLLWFCFLKTNNIKRFNCKVFFHQSCVFCWFPVLISLSNPFFLSLFFPGIHLCFLFHINVFGFKKHKLKNTNFWSKGELQQNGFFLITCVLQNVKSYRFLFAPFLAKFWLMFEKHYKNRYFSTFSKAKAKKNDHFEGLLSGPSKGYYLGQVCCNIKMANLAQIITLQIFAHTFFFQKKVLKPLFL